MGNRISTCLFIGLMAIPKWKKKNTKKKKTMIVKLFSGNNGRNSTSNNHRIMCDKIKKRKSFECKYQKLLHIIPETAGQWIGCVKNRCISNNHLTLISFRY